MDENGYKIAYEHQMRRNEMLQQRVRNLHAELEQQKSDFARMLSALEISPFGITKEEGKFIRSWIIEFEVEAGWLLDPTGYKHGIRNLAMGYTADGEEELDLDNEHDMLLHDTANHLDRLRAYFEID
jgi:hypothetical protein